MGRKEKRRLYGDAIVMIPQNPMTAFNPSLKIGRQMKETLALHSDYPTSALEGKIKEALERAGLSESGRVYHSYPYTLSGGIWNSEKIADYGFYVDSNYVVVANIRLK